MPMRGRFSSGGNCDKACWGERKPLEELDPGLALAEYVGAFTRGGVSSTLPQV